MLSDESELLMFGMLSEKLCDCWIRVVVRGFGS